METGTEIEREGYRKTERKKNRGGEMVKFLRTLFHLSSVAYNRILLRIVRWYKVLVPVTVAHENGGSQKESDGYLCPLCAISVCYTKYFTARGLLNTVFHISHLLLFTYDT